MNDRLRVLFVEDDNADRRRLEQNLARLAHDWDIEISRGGKVALDRLRGKPFDVVVSDIDNRHMNGEDFLEAVLQEMPQVARVVLSSKADTARLHRVADDEHFYLKKGCAPELFVKAIEEAGELHRWLQEHPRPISTEELLAIMVEFFQREILHQKISLSDIPEGIRPHLSQKLLESMVAEPPNSALDDTPRIEDVWFEQGGWTNQV